jgi:hypothetical protein
MRLLYFNAALNCFARSANERPIRNDQRAIGISDIPRRAFGVASIWQFRNRVAVRYLSVFRMPAGWTPTSTGISQFQCRVQRAPINAGLPARDYFQRKRLVQLQP